MKSRHDLFINFMSFVFGFIVCFVVISFRQSSETQSGFIKNELCRINDSVLLTSSIDRLSKMHQPNMKSDKIKILIICEDR